MFFFQLELLEEKLTTAVHLICFSPIEASPKKNTIVLSPTPPLPDAFAVFIVQSHKITRNYTWPKSPLKTNQPISLITESISCCYRCWCCLHNEIPLFNLYDQAISDFLLFLFTPFMFSTCFSSRLVTICQSSHIWRVRVWDLLFIVRLCRCPPFPPSQKKKQIFVSIPFSTFSVGIQIAKVWLHRLLKDFPIKMFFHVFEFMRGDKVSRSKISVVFRSCHFLLTYDHRIK